MDHQAVTNKLKELLPKGSLGYRCPFCGRKTLRLHDGSRPWKVKRKGRVVAEHHVPWFSCLCGCQGTALYLLTEVTRHPDARPKLEPR